MSELYTYVIESYQDPMFLLFPVYSTLLGIGFYLLFALPLTAIAHYDPKSLRKYKVSDEPIDVKKYFWKSLGKLFSHNILLLIIVCAMWPLTRVFGVHAGELPPWYLIIAQILFFLYVDDFITYWAHKGLHTPWLYRHVHSVHHRVKHPSAMDNSYFHWAEYLILVTTGQIAPLLMGAHVYVIWAWLFIRIWQSVGGHSGYSFPWTPLRLIPLFEGGDYHYYHHTDQRGNMSGILPYLDRIWGRTSPTYTKYKQAQLNGKRKRWLKLSW